ncbi:hypothetical protein PCL_09623 [Purpureocillium lilacinum]|uniref:Uncharacterized protein n=1 Tax=Purpureocillium lilacinum TaxID=33203 RepID=A0A2U3DQE0_PURLI|nr:hypothetical protein PCL_09623 [Purpureocillium lilacinum]
MRLPDFCSGPWGRAGIAPQYQNSTLGPEMCRTRTLGARLAEEAKTHQRRAPAPREPAGVAHRPLRGVRFLPAAREKGAEEASRREHRLRGAELRALMELLESHDVWTADEEPLVGRWPTQAVPGCGSMTGSDASEAMASRHGA